MPYSCEEIGSLFEYDAEASLELQEVSRRPEEGVTVIDLTYASPLGGRVPATLVVPDGRGPFAGILYQHGMPSTRQPLIPGAVTYARTGAVVLLIDAPFARRENGLDVPLTFTEQDRREQVQLIVDLRRGIDLLLARPEVDPQRLAYVGISYGGAMGGLLAGVENRLKAYVLQVGDGGLVTHVTGPEDTDMWLAKPEDVRRQWLGWMWPIEPIHYVGCTAPAALLFQNGTLDAMVPPADALRYQQAGSKPKTIRWYKDGHGLGIGAGRDQAKWLSETIGIGVASYRPMPPSVETGLAAWSLLVVASLVSLSWDLWQAKRAARGACLMWLLTTVFLGPLGWGIYWISGREPPTAGGSAGPVSPSRRALGSAAWAASGNILGGIGVLALLLYLPRVFGAYLVLQVAAVFLVPFCAGLLTFAVSRWVSLPEAAFDPSYCRPLFVEVVSTCLVLVGVYPTVNLLIARCLTRWASPFGFDLSYPPLWGGLCLATAVGMLVAYPFHLWMLWRGVIRWGVVPLSVEAGPGGLAWYVKVALILPSFALMLGAIFWSMQIA